MVSASYRINVPAVVLEFFDDEVILVNLDAGAYYSVSGAGARFVALIEPGQSVAAAAAILKAEYEAPEGLIEESVMKFVTRLEEETLIVPHEGTSEATEIRPGARRTWSAPDLQKYTDLRDLLLLDPIHDVDESGWPVRKPAGA